jgi:hypothetical protein
MFRQPSKGSQVPQTRNDVPGAIHRSESRWSRVTCVSVKIEEKSIDQQLISKSREKGLRAINATPVSNDPAITTQFGPRKSDRTTPEPSAGSAWTNFGRFLGRALVFFAVLLLLLSGYLAFTDYWIQRRWAKSEATVLSGEVRERSSGSASTLRSGGRFSNSHFFHCRVSYPVESETRQSELDSPASPYRMDAQVWAATWSRGQHIAILYNPSNPSKIRLADNPSEVTAMGSLRVAFYFFVPGILLILTSRRERVDFR